MGKNELYIGNLGKDATRKDIERAFEKYGRLLRCDVKDKGYGTVYAFLEFEEERDAEDALKSENGKDMAGSSMVVQWAKSKSEKRDYGGRDSRAGYGGGGDRRGGPPGGRSIECYECGERGHIARDCRRRGGGGAPRRNGSDRGGSGRYSNGNGRDSGRDSGRDRERRRERSRSRSKSNRKDSKSKSRSKSPKERSPKERSRSRSRS